MLSRVCGMLGTCGAGYNGARGGQRAGHVSAFRAVAAPSWRISRSLIAYRDNAVERLDIAVLSFGQVALPSEFQRRAPFPRAGPRPQGHLQHRLGNRNKQITYALVSD